MTLRSLLASMVRGAFEACAAAFKRARECGLHEGGRSTAVVAAFAVTLSANASARSPRSV
jgi:hypothetical protein